MLFNSYVFIFAFLPVALLGFAFLERRTHRAAALAWLVLCSLFYYGWWNPNYVLLIGFSIFFNFTVGVYLAKPHVSVKGWGLAVGIAVNLGLLGYYKYANFFVDSVNAVASTSYTLAPIVLPLAISFFTFQQIAYLVDAYRGETREYNFVDYCLFVTFFPQLIAGPIVHHAEMLPQFTQRGRYRINSRDLSVGITVFVIGLFKKIIIADQIALHATPVFDAALQGQQLTFANAWLGALAYSFQLYFDFSGYSDMAIGIGNMFGIRLPVNFHSPYKAVNIIDFWRRWHITLSRFLRDYLYVPLGGNRKGKARRYVNLMVAMLLGGLWHGAGWTFVFWGLLHGFYLVINHGWHAVRRNLGYAVGESTAVWRMIGQVITFIVVVIAWVFFRAEGFDAAWRMIRAMAFMEGIDVSAAWIVNKSAIMWVAALCIFVFLLPNTQELMAEYQPALLGELRRRPVGVKSALIRWRPTTVWAIILAVMALVAVMRISTVSEFIYYQF